MYYFNDSYNNNMEKKLTRIVGTLTLYLINIIIF